MPYRLLFNNITALALLLVPLTAVQSGPLKAGNEQPAVARVKAVQVILLEESDLRELPARLRTWKDAGFDTVVLRAFHLAGDRPHGPAAKLVDDTSRGVYFPTGQAKVITDLISPFAAMCREQDLKAFAWMVTRDARFDRTDLPTEMIYDPPSGKTRPVPRLDVMDPSVIEYLERLFADLARTGIDGILLQDDLSSRMQEGFTRGNITRYMFDTGARVKPYAYLTRETDGSGQSYFRASDGFDRWTTWKTHRLAYVARRLQQAVDRAAPGTVLAMNQMYETLTDPAKGRLWLSQDLMVSLEEGPLYAALMLYHQQMQSELEIGLTETLSLVSGALNNLSGKVDPSRIILKFQTMDWDTEDAVPAADLLSALRTVRDEKWSLAFTPPPTEQQLKAITPVLRGIE